MNTETRSTCPYCGVGCGVIIESDGAQITGVRGDPDHPANFGRLCTKGSTLALTASASVTKQARLLQPMQRAQRGQDAAPVSWDQALNLATDMFAQIIQQDGPDAVGFYVSGQLLTEDYYVFNKLVKGLIGTNNIDTNSRLCMSSAVAGYKQTLGADAPPTCYEDVNHAQCIFIAGSNTAYAHPILFRRIEDAKAANQALKIIFCDPRRTATAEIADLYLPLLPGTIVQPLQVRLASDGNVRLPLLMPKPLPLRMTMASCTSDLNGTDFVVGFFISLLYMDRDAGTVQASCTVSAS